MSILFHNDTIVNDNNYNHYTLVNDTNLNKNNSGIINSVKSKSLSIGNSNTNELNQLETEIGNIVNSKRAHEDKSKIDAFKDVLSGLHNQIVGLMEQITFLREDSLKKSNIITSLIEINKSKENQEYIMPVKFNVSDNSEGTQNDVSVLHS